MKKHKLPAQFMGEIQDKFEVTSRYNTALVIENSSEYYSEKIFDAFVSGCYPIYVGFSGLVEEGVPQELFTLCEPTTAHVTSAISSSIEIDFVEYRKKLRAWLDSDYVKAKWSEQHVWNRVVDAVLRPSH